MLHDEMWHMCNVVSTACVNNYEVTHSVYIHTQQKPSSRDSSDSIIAAGIEIYSEIYTTIPQPFYGPFSGTTRVSRCQKRTSGLYGASKD